MTKKNNDTRGQVRFMFVKVSKKTLPTGIMSVVYKAMQIKKAGRVEDIAKVAVRVGLAKVTSQDPVTQTHVMLNRLRKLGVTKKTAAL